MKQEGQWFPLVDEVFLFCKNLWHDHCRNIYIRQQNTVLHHSDSCLSKRQRSRRRDLSLSNMRTSDIHQIYNQILSSCMAYFKQDKIKFIFQKSVVTSENHSKSKNIGLKNSQSCFSSIINTLSFNFSLLILKTALWPMLVSQRTQDRYICIKAKYLVLNET